MDAWPDGIVAGPIEVDDTPAGAELMAAVERVDQTGEHYSAEDLREDLTIPDLRRETDTIALWSGDRMIGYGLLRSKPGQRELAKVDGMGAVHPQWRRRGIGRALLDWTDHQATDLWQARHPDLPGELSIGAISSNTGLIAMLGAAGFEVNRHYFDMKLELGSAPVEPAAFDGLRLIPFDPAYDEATRVAHNEAFLDHWGSIPTSAETWAATHLGSRAFRPAMSYLLLDGNDVAAYVLSYEYEADTAATGIRDLYIGQIGTRRPYRGRGAARTLLAAVLEAAAKDGFQTSSLGVDSQNPTGALGLYERVGYRVAHRWINHRRALPGVRT